MKQQNINSLMAQESKNDFNFEKLDSKAKEQKITCGEKILN